MINKKFLTIFLAFVSGSILFTNVLAVNETSVNKISQKTIPQMTHTQSQKTTVAPNANIVIINKITPVKLLQENIDEPTEKKNISKVNPYIPLNEEVTDENCEHSANPLFCREDLQQEQALKTVSFDSSDFNLSGPLTVSAIYSEQFGPIGRVQYTWMISKKNAISLMIDGGPDELRGNMTLAHQFNQTNRIKLTYEYLRQRMPFDFAAGTDKQWIAQNALGADYNHLIDYGIFHSFDIVGSYVTANNQTLTPAILNNDGVDLRYIAGGTEENSDLKLNLLPTENFEISPSIGYSRLQYHTIYQPQAIKSQFDYGLATTAAFGGRTKLLAGYQNVVDSDQYNLGISHTFAHRINVGVTGSYINGKNGQPNDTQVIFSLTLVSPQSHTSSISRQFTSLVLWTAHPAVFKQQILANKDESN